MDSQQTKNIWIGVIVIALIAGAYYFGTSSKNSTESTQNTQDTTTTAITQEQPVKATASVALKSKCATDGQTFYLNFYKQFTQVKSTWFDPQFHFNSTLNTCLVYVSWNDTSIPITWGNSNFDYTQIVTNNNIVYDVYSNQAVLQMEITKTYNKVNGKVEETDTPSNYPYAQNIPNSNYTNFDNQFKILMAD